LSVAATPYLDPALAVADRVDDLLGRMTLEEKLAQLGSIWVFEVLDGDRLEHGKAQERLGPGIGQITARGRGARASRCPSSPRWPTRSSASSWSARAWASRPSSTRSACTGSSRATRCASRSPIGLAAAWDPHLLEALASSFARQLRAIGAHQGLAPIFDVARDPRWGRIEETYGEDPYLIAALGVAYVRGLQEGGGGPVLRPASTWSATACPRAA
jgi:beta-glucosidase